MGDIDQLASESQDSRKNTRGKSLRLAMDNSVYEPFEEGKTQSPKFGGNAQKKKKGCC